MNLLTIPMLLLHGVEEYNGPLYETLPPRFGLPPIEPRFFVIFNLVWFVALLGCIGNAVFHGWLALQIGGYVPGDVTALLMLPLGVTLVLLLGGNRRSRQ